VLLLARVEVLFCLVFSGSFYPYKEKDVFWFILLILEVSVGLWLINFLFQFIPDVSDETDLSSEESLKTDQEN